MSLDILNIKSNTKIDILVLLHNDIDILPVSFSSLNKWSGAKCNILYMDNASTDKSKDYVLEAAKNSDNISLMYSKTNLGIIDGRNFIYEESKKYLFDAEFILFLDCDQIISENTIDSYLELIDEGYDLVSAYAWQMRENDFFPVRMLNPKEKSFYNYLGAGGLCIKKSVFEAVGMFDVLYSPAYWEDPSLIFSVFDFGYKIIWNRNANIEHRQSKSPSETRQRSIQFQISWKKFRQKWKGRKLPVFYN